MNKAIRIKKIKECEDALHPHNIPVDEERTIVLFEDAEIPVPTIGERFDVIGPFRWFSTSAIREIIDEHTFKTYNSVYEWEVIDMPCLDLE